jgi:predicted site-specific integrase-resolvase
VNERKLTPAEVAERLNVSVITVRLWCRRGLFPRAESIDTPRGSYWEIPEGDVKSFNQPSMGRPPKPKEEKASKVSKKR